MTKEEVKAQANYWFLSAEHDYETMIGLFRIERYSDSLFYGHIVLEKTLKALLVIETEKFAAPIHNLTILAESARIELTDRDKSLLRLISSFNIRARYPDNKLAFYKICDGQYAADYLNKIINLYKNLCRQPKLKLLLNNSPNC